MPSCASSRGHGWPARHQSPSGEVEIGRRDACLERLRGIAGTGVRARFANRDWSAKGSAMHAARMLVAILAALVAAACYSREAGSPCDTGSTRLSDLPLVFAPMYSAFDGEHVFKLPVAPLGGVSVASWEVLDDRGVARKDVVDLVPDASFGGAMITTHKSGDYTVRACAANQLGSAPLHITQADPSVWATGQQRYGEYIDLAEMPHPSGATWEPARDVSCKNCHGEGPMYLAVEYTPQQTGGYSNTELGNIITMGAKPTGEVVDSGVPLSIFQWFHTWTATDEERQGLVIYLRSLKPKSQGARDFGGLMPANGTATP